MDLAFAAAYSREEGFESPQKKKKVPRHTQISNQQVRKLSAKYSERTKSSHGTLSLNTHEAICISFTPLQIQGNGYKQREALTDEYEYEDWEMGGDLPTVDDLEVAALAAEAAMEAVNIKESHILNEGETSSSEVSGEMVAAIMPSCSSLTSEVFIPQTAGSHNVKHFMQETLLACQEDENDVLTKLSHAKAN